MDLTGPFPVSNAVNQNILVVMDYFREWSEVYAIHNQEANTIVNVSLNKRVCLYGAPIELHSDQGRNFVSTVFKDMCEVYRIKKSRTMPDRMV